MTLILNNLRDFDNYCQHYDLYWQGAKLSVFCVIWLICGVLGEEKV